MSYTVEQLSAIEEIRQCKANYFRTMDYKQWDELKDCFTEDFRFEMITPLQGRTTMDPPGAEEKIGRDPYIEALKVCLDGVRTSHHGHAQNVTLTGENTADSWTALEDRVDLFVMGLCQHGQAYYKEKYVKCDDGKWRIRRMSIRYIRVKYVPLEETEYMPLPDYDRMSTIFDD